MAAGRRRLDNRLVTESKESKKRVAIGPHMLFHCPLCKVGVSESRGAFWARDPTIRGHWGSPIFVSYLNPKRLNA